jgi:uncharacterized membrane protein YfhO
MLRTASLRTGVRPYPRIDSIAAAERVAVDVVEYRANEMTLRLSAPDSGWLMVTDRWAPGWRATVNAKPVSTFGANFIFRAVPVGRGENVVHFSYTPAGYPWLLAVSWLTLAGVLGWSVTENISSDRRLRGRLDGGTSSFMHSKR